MPVGLALAPTSPTEASSWRTTYNSHHPGYAWIPTCISTSVCLAVDEYGDARVGMTVMRITADLHPQLRRPRTRALDIRRLIEHGYVIRVKTEMPGRVRLTLSVCHHALKLAAPMASRRHRQHHTQTHTRGTSAAAGSPHKLAGTHSLADDRRPLDHAGETVTVRA